MDIKYILMQTLYFLQRDIGTITKMNQDNQVFKKFRNKFQIFRSDRAGHVSTMNLRLRRIEKWVTFTPSYLTRARKECSKRKSSTTLLKLNVCRNLVN